jgi:hypothetical protein
VAGAHPDLMQWPTSYLLTAIMLYHKI